MAVAASSYPAAGPWRERPPEIPYSCQGESRLPPNPTPDQCRDSIALGQKCALYETIYSACAGAELALERQLGRATTTADLGVITPGNLTPGCIDSHCQKIEAEYASVAAKIATCREKLLSDTDRRAVAEKNAAKGRLQGEINNLKAQQSAHAPNSQEWRRLEAEIANKTAARDALAREIQVIKSKAQAAAVSELQAAAGRAGGLKDFAKSCLSKGFKIGVAGIGVAGLSTVFPCLVVVQVGAELANWAADRYVADQERLAAGDLRGYGWAQQIARQAVVNFLRDSRFTVNPADYPNFDVYYDRAVAQNCIDQVLAFAITRYAVLAVRVARLFNLARPDGMTLAEQEVWNSRAARWREFMAQSMREGFGEGDLKEGLLACLENGIILVPKATRTPTPTPTPTSTPTPTPTATPTATPQFDRCGCEYENDKDAEVTRNDCTDLDAPMCKQSFCCVKKGRDRDTSVSKIWCRSYAKDGTSQTGPPEDADLSDEDCNPVVSSSNSSDSSDSRSSTNSSNSNSSSSSSSSSLPGGTNSSHRDSSTENSASSNTGTHSSNDGHQASSVISSMVSVSSSSMSALENGSSSHPSSTNNTVSTGSSQWSSVSTSTSSRVSEINSGTSEATENSSQTVSVGSSGTSPGGSGHSTISAENSSTIFDGGTSSANSLQEVSVLSETSTDGSRASSSTATSRPGNSLSSSVSSSSKQSSSFHSSYGESLSSANSQESTSDFSYSSSSMESVSNSSSTLLIDLEVAEQVFSD